MADDGDGMLTMELQAENLTRYNGRNEQRNYCNDVQ
jgi:hypothetical protein